MTKPEKMINELKALGIQLSRKGEKLHWEGPKDAMTPALTLKLKEHKPEIMRLLEGQAEKQETERRVPNRLIRGDCRAALKQMADNSVDLMVTDPPYGLEFMGKGWDKEVPSLSIWQECLRVLKPGAFAFIMCSPRQDLQRRMIDTLEQAGFETGFSPIFWTYARGMPKGHNISKAIDKKIMKGSTATRETKTREDKEGKYNPVSPEARKFEGAFAGFQPKPAVEVILVAMKPKDKKSYTDQALANGKGVTWLDDCRVPYSEGEIKGKASPDSKSRCPANLLVSNDILGEYSRFFSLECWAEKLNLKELPQRVREALPFLIIPKPSSKEREEGLANLEKKPIKGRDKGQDKRINAFKARPTPRKNIHPTVKPIELMMYLIIMGSREGDLVLDPLMGSGTTAKAALAVNRRIVGIEIENDYFDIARTKYKTAFVAKHYPPPKRSQETTVNEESAGKDTQTEAQGPVQE